MKLWIVVWLSKAASLCLEMHKTCGTSNHLGTNIFAYYTFQWVMTSTTANIVLKVPNHPLDTIVWVVHSRRCATDVFRSGSGTMQKTMA
jgi:hypothetical protein